MDLEGQAAGLQPGLVVAQRAAWCTKPGDRATFRAEWPDNSRKAADPRRAVEPANRLRRAALGSADWASAEKQRAAQQEKAVRFTAILARLAGSTANARLPRYAKELSTRNCAWPIGSTAMLSNRAFDARPAAKTTAACHLYR
jgi:hypothetical protein